MARVTPAFLNELKNIEKKVNPTFSVTDRLEGVKCPYYLQVKTIWETLDDVNRMYGIIEIYGDKDHITAKCTNTIIDIERLIE